MPKQKKYLPIIILILIGVLFFVLKPNAEPAYEKISSVATHPRGSEFADPNLCISCHKDIHDQHIQTPHFLTSAVADTSSVKGSFSENAHKYQLNKDVSFKMIKEDSILYEAIFIRDSLVAKQKMDIVIGSGTKGQSYLTWRDSTLYQLQVSYYTPTNEWTNSPGMPKRLRSRRPIFGDCLECHATFAKSNSNYMDNAFDKKQIMFGIDCQKCHNPAKDHAEFHINNPEVTEAKNIMLYDTLTRQKRLDACILCHSGLRTLTKPPFSFLAGDNLNEYSLPPRADKNAQPDVHGNQYQLLTMSECFKQTTMDCMTCHNPHKKERGDFKSFNNTCIGCHTTPKAVCKEKEDKRLAKNNNCISCHMPLLPSKVLKVEVDENGETTPLMVRTHHITTYIDSLAKSL